MPLAQKKDLLPDAELIARAKDEWERTFDALPDLVAVLDDQYRIARVNRAMASRLGRPPGEIIGQHCYELIHGVDKPLANCPHALLRQDGREHIAELHEPRIGGHVLVSCSPLRDDQGRVAGCVHIAQDINQRKADEMTTQNQNLCLEALHQTALDLMHRRDLAELLSSMLNQAIALMGSSHGWVALLEGSHMVFKVGAGLLERLPGIQIKPGQGFSGRVWQAGGPLTLEDYNVIPERLTLPEWKEIKAVAGVPIFAHCQVQGVLAVARGQDQPAFEPGEMEILARFGNLASLALDNARLNESARRELAERRQAEDALK